MWICFSTTEMYACFFKIPLLLVFLGTCISCFCIIYICLLKEEMSLYTTVDMFCHLRTLDTLYDCHKRSSEIRTNSGYLFYCFVLQSWMDFWIHFLIYGMIFLPIIEHFHALIVTNLNINILVTFFFWYIFFVIFWQKCLLRKYTAAKIMQLSAIHIETVFLICENRLT